MKSKDAHLKTRFYPQLQPFNLLRLEEVYWKRIWTYKQYHSYVWTRIFIILFLCYSLLPQLELGHHLVPKPPWHNKAKNFIRCPSTNTVMSVFVSRKINLSVSDLMIIHLTPGYFSRPCIAISLSKWLMLQTMALSFIFPK